MELNADISRNVMGIPERARIFEVTVSIHFKNSLGPTDHTRQQIFPIIVSEQSFKPRVLTIDSFELTPSQIHEQMLPLLPLVWGDSRGGAGVERCDDSFRPRRSPTPTSLNAR
jgi:hypothetical protein